jgi:hypothetical protein
MYKTREYHNITVKIMKYLLLSDSAIRTFLMPQSVILHTVKFLNDMYGFGKWWN